MKKELIVKIYKRIKELKLDENKVLSLMNLSDNELSLLLDLDNEQFKEKLNTTENTIELENKTLDDDVNIFNNNLKKVFKNKIKEEDLNTILNLKLTSEQLGKLIAIVNNVDKDSKLDAIIRMLSIIKHKRVKGDNIVKMVDSFANAKYSNILDVIITFLKKTELEPEEIVVLTKSMVMFEDDGCLKATISLINSIKDVNYVAEMLEFLSSFKLKEAVKEACEIIKGLYKKCNKERIFEILDCISKIRYESFVPFECVSELAIKYPKLDGLPKILEYIIEMQRSNRMYDFYNFVKNNNVRKHPNLMEFVEFIVKSESFEKSKIMSKMLMNEDVLNNEKCLEYAKLVYEISNDSVVKCASELVQNPNLLEKDLVRKSVVMLSSSSLQLAKGIFGILNCNKLIEKEMSLSIAEMFINQKAEVVNFVSEKMLDDSIVENEFFEKAIEIIANSKFLITLDCVRFIVENSNILGIELVNNALEIVEFNEKESNLNYYDDRQRKIMESDIIMLYLKLIEEVKQKIEFMKNFEENSELAIENLEKEIALENERKLAISKNKKDM